MIARRSSMQRSRTSVRGTGKAGAAFTIRDQRGICLGITSKISWTQVEVGSAITWKYPSVVLRSDDSIGGFYSVALTTHCQQGNTETK
jgi:Fe-S cluster assembly scaffold protein SufB